MTEFDRMVTTLDAMWCARDQIVPCLIGPVGIGKTAAVMQHAKNVGANNVVTIIASQILPSEVSGITMPDDTTKSMQIYDHYRLSSLKDGDILFFDELLEADQSVLSACLTLIESRMMMSGRLLPDIQIIAATNPTIQPNSLKESIRQRFMFINFDKDAEQTKMFIKNTTGIELDEEVLRMLESTSTNFNILSPRSLTKLCDWMARSPVESRMDVGIIINKMWGNSIGSKIYECMRNSERPTKHQQAKTALRNAVQKAVSSNEYDDEIDQGSFAEVIEKLQSLDVWPEIEKALAEVMIEEEPMEELPVDF